MELKTSLSKYSKNMLQEKFSNNLTLLTGMLEEGLKCLKHDRENSMERGVRDNMAKMRDTVKDFMNFIDYM